MSFVPSPLAASHRSAGSLGAVLLLVAALVIGCGSQAKNSTEDETATAIPVDVAIVERGSATAELSSTAAL